MSFCLRVDIDLSPHSGVEPAVVARLLKLSRDKGYVYHFFATRRTLDQLFVLQDVLESEGHRLGLLCKTLGHFDSRPQGFTGLAVEWPWEGDAPDCADFLVAPAGHGARVYVSSDLGKSDPLRRPGLAVLRVDASALAAEDANLMWLEAQVDRWLMARRPMVLLPFG